MVKTIREELQVFVRRFGLLNASCCEDCCGEQVSMAQSHILFEVRRLGTPSIQRVAEELGMDITTFSRQVKALEARGFVRKEVSPEDRRVSLLGLTEQGSRVVGQIDRFMSDKLDQIFAYMTPFEQETVIKSLGLLNDAVAKAGDCAGKLPSKKVACCK